jgi:putative ABC transport system substrate-binding protein
MSEDAGCAKYFLCASLATVVKPISELRLLISGLCAMLFVLSSSAQAQQPTKIPRIGYLSGSASRSDNPTWHEAFRQGLRDLGYIEGKNIAIEWRFGEGKRDRGPALASELAHLKVDVLLRSAQEIHAQPRRRPPPFPLS